ncbi:uncharacterized protein LOC134186999 isoform X2 [Corticium candelabrum]|uniref:uncharacterized protein LOC134186999 isoform X2 n=1 Tax=Corticium candelabrum TaxID=121492 RepID=UPI002E261BE6|nr:uncharacterized protein LOC134186999 isoform X2 [Corticium candelabrum]
MSDFLHSSTLWFCFRYTYKASSPYPVQSLRTELSVLVYHLRLALAMAVEITRSRKFLKSFLVWAADTERNPKMQGYITRQSCVLVAHASGEGHQLRISLCCPDPGGQEAKMTDAEMRWGNRIMALVVTRLQLETVFAWLSTLGGAHSSLGEKFVEHAHHAGVLSKKQLLLALRLGDPILSAQCKLYYAFSLMQKGNKLDFPKPYQLKTNGFRQCVKHAKNDFSFI